MNIVFKILETSLWTSQPKGFTLLTIFDLNSLECNRALDNGCLLILLEYFRHLLL